MSSASAVFSALPVLLFAFFGLVACIALFVHVIRRMMRRSSEIDVEASAEKTTTEATLLVNAFKEEETVPTLLPTRPSQRFKTGLVVEHTFASTYPENDPQPVVRVVRYTPLKQNEAGSWDLAARVPNVTLSIVQNEKHIVIEQPHDLEYAAQSCIIEEWAPSLPVSSDAPLPNLWRSSLPTQKSRLASTIPSPSSTPRAFKKTATSTVPANTTPSAAIPALWRSSIHHKSTTTTTLSVTAPRLTPKSRSKVATATQTSPDELLSSSKSAATPSRSKSTVTVARKPRVNTRKRLDKANKENMRVEGEGRRKGRAPLAMMN
ncbi:hypothetical protein Moror_12603 [Moniliophthora roreri MCA 2997]|uniref:Uncharacterized protein n=2 Tax=Moniliophthora roreri TaxID=221103 RepID=V2XS22_MONRO|nr:hypothetical protein Moror_12603 [Moniliophthora roreri MCA 2997]KAI3621310.1 hypothetical protein WG66_014389 [Moniliophthora roreri]